MRIDTVLLKVASRCNLDCSYCYVYNMGDESWRAMPKRMTPDTQERVAAQLGRLFVAQRHPFAVVLHGGEPLLLGPKQLQTLFEILRTALPASCSISIQTNGVLMTSRVLDLCAAFAVSLSISLDGPAAVHDKNRVTLGRAGSHAAVIAGLSRIQRHPCAVALFSGVLAVVDPASDPDEIYSYFRTLGAPSIDFLYRDGNRRVLPYGKGDLGTVEYGRWMSTILDRYLTDPNPPRIRVLDDMMKLILGGAGVKEGVGLTDFGIVVVDTDGSFTKNDTLRSTPLGDRFDGRWTVNRDELVEVVRSPEFLAYHTLQQPTSPICQACPDLGVCGGGMLAHRFDTSNGYNNPSVFCADQKWLIARMRLYLTAYLAQRAVA
jgi:uncharacterized protein